MARAASRMAAPEVWIGPAGGRIDGVERIAVLRGGGLGDLLFAFPALSSLAAAYPRARITLLGTPAHAALLGSRPGPVDEVAVLPRVRGVYLPEGEAEDPAGADEFVREMREKRFDLALQLHGGGRNSNPFLLRLGARVTAGLCTPDAARLDRVLPYEYYQHEWMRALEVAGLVGAPPVALEPRIHVTPREREEALRWAPPPGVSLVVVHPGATDPRRRWPAERFAEVAARLVDAGARVVVVGDSSDVLLGERIVRLARDAARAAAGEQLRSLAGRLTLSGLVGLLSAADAFLGNDSGPRHLAQAVGCPTVSVFWAGNVINAGPLGRAEHRIHVSWTTRCPACGRDCTSAADRCAHDVSFVAQVPPAPVYADLAQLIPL
ncbi:MULTISPECIES: glycosyltransferase family 9 protein [unclassified Leifsonia]|uniref:glycosyltransferase family 9 protein n=1 Tax=unclassified Leifsonia TaxID=2663824 RepID=UPI0008A767DB|nr:MULTISPECIES: glycosyltransferase family 9 protein [unclassified Leifsonia]SEH54600.1 ADP-heptose:LPS heptosyltransferase [Leifsonia sp. CL154]SFL24435.1 ADP-heptose:LPS heptosyltransferase [Leifsonia sp. CL147]